MKSIKIKLALIANLMAVLCLVILGVVTFMFVKNEIYTEVVNAETNYVKTAKNSMESFRARNTAALKSLEKNILKHSLSRLDNQEALMQFVGQDLKTFRDAGRFLAVYIAQPSGELLISDPDSDSKNLDFGIYGKADNYDARTRDYYKEALKTNEIHITPSYIDVTTGLPCFTYAVALHKDGKFIGVLAVDVLVTDLQKEFENLPGRTFVFDSENQVFASTDKEMLNSNNDISVIANVAKERADYEHFEYIKPEDKSERFGICARTMGNYTVCVGENISKIESPVYKIAFIQITIVIFTSIASVILLYFIISYFLSPLSFIQSGLNSFFDFINHKTQDISTISINTSDELAQMAKAINENILATKQGLDQDKQAVKESV
ncbi:cache domain-containing protein, partial [Campylobacter helveticus]|uniref:cache domain-containing protein n=1 Tax=Campylobacter helveticus TaxID=28898 RepID=UPI0022EA911A